MRQIASHQSFQLARLGTDLPHAADRIDMNEGAGNVTLPIIKRRLGPEHVGPPLACFYCIIGRSRVYH